MTTYEPVGDKLIPTQHVNLPILILPNVVSALHSEVRQ